MEKDLSRFSGRPICQIGGMMLVMTMMYDGEVLTGGFMVKLMMELMIMMMIVMMAMMMVMMMVMMMALTKMMTDMMERLCSLGG